MHSNNQSNDQSSDHTIDQSINQTDRVITIIFDQIFLVEALRSRFKQTNQSSFNHSSNHSHQQSVIDRAVISQSIIRYVRQCDPCSFRLIDRSIFLQCIQHAQWGLSVDQINTLINKFSINPSNNPSVQRSINRSLISLDSFENAVRSHQSSDYHVATSSHGVVEQPAKLVDADVENDRLESLLVRLAHVQAIHQSSNGSVKQTLLLTAEESNTLLNHFKRCQYQFKNEQPADQKGVESINQATSEYPMLSVSNNQQLDPSAAESDIDLYDDGYRAMPLPPSIPDSLLYAHSNRMPTITPPIYQSISRPNNQSNNQKFTAFSPDDDVFDLVEPIDGFLIQTSAEQPTQSISQFPTESLSDEQFKIPLPQIKPQATTVVRGSINRSDNQQFTWPPPSGQIKYGASVNPFVSQPNSQPNIQPALHRTSDQPIPQSFDVFRQLVRGPAWHTSWESQVWHSF